MWQQRFLGCAVFVACALVVGCGEEKKPDAGGTPGDAKNTTPPGEQPPAPPGVGEPKYKVALTDFLKEYSTGGRAASAKYSGAVVELTGMVTRSAGVELDDGGKPVGKAGEYKASFVFGEPDARRLETIVVRGLKPSAVGSVLRGQEARVKGRVGRYNSAEPVELLDAELLSPGEDVSTPWDGSWSINKAKVVCTKVTGTVSHTGTEGTDYVDVKPEKGANIRCFLLPGTMLLYPSGFTVGTKITLAGTHTTEVSNAGPLGASVTVRDAVPVNYRDPKSK